MLSPHLLLCSPCGDSPPDLQDPTQPFEVQCAPRVSQVYTEWRDSVAASKFEPSDAANFPCVLAGPFMLGFDKMAMPLSCAALTTAGPPPEHTPPLSSACGISPVRACGVAERAQWGLEEAVEGFVLQKMAKLRSEPGPVRVAAQNRIGWIVHRVTGVEVPWDSLSTEASQCYK